MKTIVFYINNFNPRFLKRINYFKKRGFRVVLIYFDRPQSSGNKKLFVEQADEVLCLGELGNKKLLKNIWTVFASSLKMISFKEMRRAEMLYFFEMSSVAHGLLMSTFANRKAKLILEVGDLLHLEYSTIIERGFNFLMKLMSSKVALFVSTSKGFVSYFNLKGIRFKETMVLENKPVKVEALVLQPTPITEKDFTIGYVGRFRYFEVVRSFIQSLVPGEKFLFFGFSTKEAFNNLYGLDLVENMGPFTKEKGLKSIYDQLHAVYCLYEGPNEKYLSPNKLWEGIAYLTPVIINKDSYYADLVREHNLGIILDAHKPETFKIEIDRLKNNYSDICQAIFKYRHSMKNCFDDTDENFDYYLTQTKA